MPDGWSTIVRWLHSAHHPRACEQNFCPWLDSISIGCQISRPLMALHEGWPDFPSEVFGHLPHTLPIRLHLIRIDKSCSRIVDCAGFANVLYKHHRRFNSSTLDRMTGLHGVRLNDTNHAIMPRWIVKRQKVQHLLSSWCCTLQPMSVADLTSRSIKKRCTASCNGANTAKKPPGSSF